MMKRRRIIGAAAGALLAGRHAAHAERAERVWRVGILDPGIGHLFAAFRESMRDLGYTENRNVRFEERNADGKAALVSALARELVALAPDIMVTAAALPTRALLSQTRLIPVVVAAIGDAVSAGIVRTLSRPEGNVTGLTFLNTELSSKRLALLKEALPRLRRVAVFNDVNSQQNFFDEARSAGRQLGLDLHRIDIRGADDFDGAYAQAVQAGDEAIEVLASPFFNANRERLVQLALRHRLPGIYESREYAVAGGFMTYGQDLAVLFRRAASYVDRILKGAKPTDLPWEQPIRFELVVNLKTASSLGLTVAQSVLLQATELIR